MLPDIRQLVEDGHLDLEAVFADATWATHDDNSTSYRAEDENGDMAECNVIIETATAYGIVAYRWADRNTADGSYIDCGPVCLDDTDGLGSSEAEAGAQDYADDNNEETE